MLKRTRLLIFVLVTGISLAACGGPATQPLSFQPAPWQSGEVSQYDLLDRSGQKVGSAMWAWERLGNEWQQRYELTVNGVPDAGAVALTEDLKPISSWREVGGKRYDTSYGATTIEIKTTGTNGAVTTKTVPATAGAVDNDASLQLQRAMPLAANYATRYTDIIPTNASAAPILLSVTGAETITVPAGTFSTWHVKMAVGATAHEAWYAQEAPYAMVKYVNTGSGASFVLTNATGGAAASAGATGPASGTPAPTVSAGSGPGEMAPINGLLLAVMVGIQLPFLIGLPILLGWYIKRRYGVDWGVFGWGIVSFVLSQLIHIPLNAALGLIGLPLRGVALWPTLPLGLVLGLSAAVCEEGARLLVITVFAKRIRGWRSGVQFGAGHGGAESIILGLVVAVNLVAILSSRNLGPVAQMLPADAMAELRTAQGAFWGQSAVVPLVSVIERTFALTMQVALSVLVVQAVTYRRPLYFLGAIGLHAVVDAWTVWSRTLGVVAIEAGAAAGALISLWIIWRLREQPATPAFVLSSGTSSGPVPSAANLSERQLSLEELARRAERSRYE